MRVMPLVSMQGTKFLNAEMPVLANHTALAQTATIALAAEYTCLIWNTNDWPYQPTTYPRALIIYAQEAGPKPHYARNCEKTSIMSCQSWSGDS